MVEERAAAGAIVERPALRVLHEAGLVFLGLDLPQLLEADAVLLRLAALGQIELGDELLGERAARALGDDRVLAAQLHAAREAVGRLAVLADAHVAGRDADHRALVVVEHLGRREARIHLDAQFGRLLAEPAADVAEAGDVVAVIVHQRRHGDVGQPQRAGRAQVVEAVVASPAVSSGAPFAFQSGMSRLMPIGSITAPDRICAPTSEPFSSTTTETSLAVLRGELPQADRRGEAGGPCPDDHHVEVHTLAWRQLVRAGHLWSFPCLVPLHPFDRSSVAQASSSPFPRRALPLWHWAGDALCSGLCRTAFNAPTSPPCSRGTATWASMPRVADEPVNWLEKGAIAPGGSFRLGASPPKRSRRHRAAGGAAAHDSVHRPDCAPRRARRPPAVQPARQFPTAAPDAAVMAAREIARSAATLDALHQALAGFQGCGLKATAKNLCFYRGSRKARLMIIGEAPGRDEDLEGKPFVGRAGQLLDKMLAAIDLSEADVHITNIVYWRPPGNRTPTPQEAQICRPFLDRQMELVAPKVVVMLGGAAAGACWRQPRAS